MGPPETLWATKKQRLTLVVVRLRAASRAPGSQATAAIQQAALSLGDNVADEDVQMELGLARPCDECAKVICALGCFRRIVHSAADGCLTSVAPEELLSQCTPSSGKRQQRRAAMAAGQIPQVAGTKELADTSSGSGGSNRSRRRRGRRQR